MNACFLLWDLRTTCKIMPCSTYSLNKLNSFDADRSAPSNLIVIQMRRISRQKKRWRRCHDASWDHYEWPYHDDASSQGILTSVILEEALTHLQWSPPARRIGQKIITVFAKLTSLSLRISRPSSFGIIVAMKSCYHCTHCITCNKRKQKINNNIGSIHLDDYLNAFKENKWFARNRGLRQKWSKCA